MMLAGGATLAGSDPPTAGPFADIFGPNGRLGERRAEDDGVIGRRRGGGVVLDLDELGGGARREQHEQRLVDQWFAGQSQRPQGLEQARGAAPAPG